MRFLATASKTRLIYFFRMRLSIFFLTFSKKLFKPHPIPQPTSHTKTLPVKEFGLFTLSHSDMSTKIDGFVKCSQTRLANSEEYSVLVVPCIDEGYGATQHADSLQSRQFYSILATCYEIAQLEFICSHRHRFSQTGVCLSINARMPF